MYIEYHIVYQSFTLTAQVSSNNWVFICITVDLFNQEISLAISNTIVFQKVRSDIQIPHDVQKVEISWLNFPEKLTLINIHSTERTEDKFICGEPGDLYSWNLKGWHNEGSKPNDTLLTSKELTYQICNTLLPVYVLPKMSFLHGIKMCKSMGGIMYYEHTAFEELMQLEEEGKPLAEMGVFIPYTDEKEEGVFRHVNTGKPLKNITDYFMRGQPNGGRQENCLVLNSIRLWDVDCNRSEFYSLCQIPKSNQYLTLRGLCLESQVERFYSAGNNDGAFIWLGYRNALIQYTSRWFLNSKVSRNVWAASKASYTNLLIGTHAWEIHNEIQCYDDVHTTNLKVFINRIHFT